MNQTIINEVSQVSGPEVLNRLLSLFALRIQRVLSPRPLAPIALRRAVREAVATKSALAAAMGTFSLIIALLAVFVASRVFNYYKAKKVRLYQ